MARCFLCGGILSDGKCTECGLDNRKNDKKYQLNVHNESGVHFHDGSCEEHVNEKEHPILRDSLLEHVMSKQSTRKTEKAGETFDYSKVLRESKNKKTVKKDSKKQVPASRSGKLLSIIILLIILFFLLMQYIPQGEFLSGIPYAFSGKNSMSAFQTTGQKEIEYDRMADTYYETKLENGIYEVGYDLPAGSFQFSCMEGSPERPSAGYITWLNRAKKNFGSVLVLFSETAAKTYTDSMNKKSSYGERSGEMVLESGDILFVEDFENESLSIRGQMKENEFHPEIRDEQGIEKAVLPRNGMVAGIDFEAGVYDVLLNPLADTWFGRLEMKPGDEVFRELYGNHMTLLLTESGMKYHRIPMEKGTELRIEEGEENTIMLVPSF